MKDLIEALTIISQYVTPGSQAERRPTNCSHDTFAVCVFDSDSWGTVAEEHKVRLAELGFSWCEDDEVLISYRFGSC